MRQVAASTVPLVGRIMLLLLGDLGLKSNSATQHNGTLGPMMLAGGEVGGPIDDN